MRFIITQVGPSYQLSYSSLPYRASGKLGGLTLKKQFERAFEENAKGTLDYLQVRQPVDHHALRRFRAFLISQKLYPYPSWVRIVIGTFSQVGTFNEHVAQPQPNAFHDVPQNLTWVHSIGLGDDDSQPVGGTKLWVDMCACLMPCASTWMCACALHGLALRPNLTSSSLRPCWVCKRSLVQVRRCHHARPRADQGGWRCNVGAIRELHESRQIGRGHLLEPGKTVPLCYVSTIFLAETLHLPCVSTTIAAKTVLFRALPDRAMLSTRGRRPGDRLG